MLRTLSRRHQPLISLLGAAAERDTVSIRPDRADCRQCVDKLFMKALHWSRLQAIATTSPAVFVESLWTQCLSGSPHLGDLS